MKNTYDAIISLGGFCGAAAQLRARGLRTTAYPFDWLYMESPSAIRWLIHAFATTFDDFCLRENLRPITRPGVGGMARYKYVDSISGYGFIHHFHHSIDEGGYNEVYPVFKRRIKRMLDVFRPQKRVLLILATIFEFEPQLAEGLLRTIRLRFPETIIDLHVVQFGVKFSNPTILADKIIGPYSFIGERYARHHGDYDNSRTSYEWNFLDNLILNNHCSRKLQGLTKIRFKIWKNLSRYLRDHGCGCLGVRFHG